MNNVIDTAFINRQRQKKGLQLLPLKNRSFIEKISKVLFMEWNFTEGIGALLMSNGVKRWRLYAINNLDINKDYTRIVSLVNNMLNYRPVSCRDECTTDSYTGHQSCLRVCEEGDDLFVRLQKINYQFDDDTDRWREQWEVKQSSNQSLVMNTKYEDEIVQQIENAKNKYIER